MKLFSLIFMLALISSSALLADDLDDFLEGELSKDIEEIDFDTIDSLRQDDQRLEDKKYRNLLPLADRKPWDPPPFKAVLEKGSNLIDLSTAQLFTINRKLFVWAREKSPGSRDSFVYTKDKVAKYLTKTVNLKSIELETDLYPDKDVNTVYKAPTKFHTTNKMFPLRNDFIFAYESVSSDYMAQIYRGTSTAGSATRFEWKAHYQSNLPVDFGFSLNWSTGIWEDNIIGQASWSSLLIGPSMQYSFGGEPGVSDWTLYTTLQKSLSHKSEKKPDYHSFSTTAWQIDLVKAFDTDWGPFLIGAGYRVWRSSIKETSEYLEQASERGESRAISFSVGYRYNWAL